MKKASGGTKHSADCKKEDTMSHEWGGSLFSSRADMVRYAYWEWACVGTDHTPATAPEPTRESIHEMQAAAGSPWIDDVSEDDIASALGVE